VQHHASAALEYKTEVAGGKSLQESQCPNALLNGHGCSVGHKKPLITNPVIRKAFIQNHLQPTINYGGK